jgi:translation initiation factor IF-2
MPVRIYDIAKKLGIENKEVLSKAKELGITAAKVPSSSLDKITAEYLEEQLGGAKPPPVETAPPPPPTPIRIVSEPPPPPEPAVEPPVEQVPEPVSDIVMPEPVEIPPAAEPAQEAAASPTAPVAVAEPPPAPMEVKAEPQPVEPPPPPPPPPAPRLGEKVGFIKLPPKPAPRTGEKVGSVKLPPRPTPGPGRRDDARGPRDEQFRGRGTAPGATRGPGPGGRAEPARPAKPVEPKFVPPTTGELITIKPPIVVRELAEQLKRKPFQLIADLMGLGVFANVNQAIDETVAQKICAKYGYRFELEKRERGAGIVHAPVKKVEVDIEDKLEDLKPRAPVVTIMGHVDHGKTTLLDVIRQANVAAGEAGGITQHIGAYTISIPHPERKTELQQITFLDTPGHAAFSAMRARGANVTDVVILVVAANDGVMPQTVEALNHALAAKVPIIVAVNKVDHPNAEPMRVRQQLQEKGIVPEEWGGSTIFMDVSALTKQGVDRLLEMLLLQAEIMELKANPHRRAKGNVIESGLEPGGPTATVLVRKGTLKIGDSILCGPFWGKVRALINEEGKRLKEAAPSVAVRVLGLNGVPEAGLEFTVVEDEKTGRTLAQERAEEARRLHTEARGKVTLENLFATLDATNQKSLKLVVKADTQGSVEAIVEALKKLESDKVSVEVIHSAVGTITESDVVLASASNAIVLGFHTRIDNGVSDVAKREGVQIKLYSIIYELIDQVREAMVGLLEPIVREVVTGSAEVRQVFELSKGGVVAGCMVSNGRLVKGKIRVLRRKALIYAGIVQSLRRFQDEVNEVRAGMECGVRIDGFNDFQAGDLLECYTSEKIAAKL